MEKASCDIGLIGLAVMGQNLVLNMNDHGYQRGRLQPHRLQGRRLPQQRSQGHPGRRRALHRGARAACSRSPRRVMLHGQGRRRVDQMIDQLLPLPRKGRHHHRRRQLALSPTPTAAPRTLAEKGILFIGTGVSGGEEGARFGPSIMPGGNPEAWPHVKEIFQSIAAKVEDGTPCCDWVGEDGAGHYVKMVHNGIEYGDMQLICEAYQLLKDGLGLDRRRAARRLRRVEQGRARQLPDRNHRAHLRQERTTTASRWSTRSSTPPARKAPASGPSSPRSISACRVTLIGESGLRPLPLRAQGRARRRLEGPRPARRTPKFTGDREGVHRGRPPRALLLQDHLLRAGLHAAARAAEKDQGWNLNFGGIALMWRGGCIIRSRFLGNIKEAFDKNPEPRQPAARRLLQRAR